MECQSLLIQTNLGLALPASFVGGGAEEPGDKASSCKDHYRPMSCNFRSAITYSARAIQLFFFLSYPS